MHGLLEITLYIPLPVEKAPVNRPKSTPTRLQDDFPAAVHEVEASVAGRAEVAELPEAIGAYEIRT